MKRIKKTNAVIGQVQEGFTQKRRIPKVPLIVVALLAGSIGTYALISSFAATQSKNCFAVPSACGYPDATNTGVPAGTTLTPSGSITASTNGQVINGMDVTGQITINANNVTVENTRVTLNSGPCTSGNACATTEILINEGVTGTVIKNSELRTASGIVCAHDIRNTSSGTVQISGDYLHGCDANLYNTGNATMSDTYGIAKVAITDDHVENIYMTDATLSVNHDTLFNPVEQTAVIFADVNGGGGGACKNHLTVNNNLIAGGGFTFYPCGNGSSAGSSSVSITNNHLARCLGAEVVSNDHHICQSGTDANGYYPHDGSYGLASSYFNNTIWTGNVWDDSLQPVCIDGSSGCGGTTTPPPVDTTAPTVSLTAPANNATVSGSTTVTASASDDTGVVGVQFKLDGSNLGSEDTSSPYSTTWDTTAAANGTHTLTAVARDAAGNTKTSSSVTVTVNNTTGGAPGGGGTTTGCTTTLSAGSGLASAISSAAAGSTICLNSGSYGNVSLSSISKTSDVTIQSASGKGATVDLTITSSKHLNFQNLTVAGLDMEGTSSNITVGHSTFTGGTELFLDNGNSAILLDSNTFSNINRSPTDYEGRIQFGGSGTGVKISNNYFSGGCSDGIQIGANGGEIGPGNEFTNIQQNGCDPLHVDPLQIYGGINLNIHDNYFHNNNTGIMAPDGGTNETITNNVFDSNDGYPPLTMGSNHNDTITHNTTNGEFRIFSGNSGQNSTNNIVENNIIGGGFDDNAGALSVEDYNVVSGGSGAHDISGKTTYVGGSDPNTFAGWALTSGSIGKGNASDGTDRGINASGSTTPPPIDTTAPTVSFSSPTNGATVSGTVTATAAASDNVGVSKVEISLDGTLKMTDISSPYNYSFDSKTLSNGAHTLTAKAYDAAGNTATSTVTINVSNTDITPPTVPTNVSATAQSATKVNLTWTASTDASGVTKYNVLRNGIVIAQPTTTSYSDTTAVASTSYSYVIQAVDAAGNISANSTAANVTTPSGSTADTTPPSTPANLAATAVSTTQINLTWNASTDNASGIAGYNVYRGTTKLNTSLVTTTTYGDNTASPGTAYTYKVEAVDGAGNKSAQTAGVSVTTLPLTDTTAPTVSITAPANNATVSGSTTVTASASDNTGVVGVQFKLDGNNLGSEDLASPYSIAWDTTGAANGTHTLTAIARDAAGNTKTASTVTVTVSNSSGTTTGGSQSKNCFAVPSACGYPDATNTGVPAGTTLTPSGSITASTNGQVINAMNVTGQITINADNVTIKNSKITAAAGGSGSFVVEAGSHTGLNITDTTILGKGTGANTLESAVHNGNGVTLQRVYMTNCADCVEYGSPLTVKDSYIVVNSIYSGAHAEDIYECSGSVDVDHSTLYNAEGQTATVFGDTICGAGNKFTVTNSLLAGGGFIVYPQANSSGTSGANTVITNNHIARCITAAVYDSGSGGTTCKGGADSNGYWAFGGYYGVSAYVSGPTTWSGNVWDDNLQAICEDGSAGCGGSTTPPPTDTTKPTVSISSPANGATVSGTVTATAPASDNVGVAKVEFSLDGSLQMTDTASPYNYSFDSKTLSNGSHTLTAKAYDAAGNTSTATTTFTVSNTDTTAPTTPTGLKATAANATTVNLTWTASTDATGVTKYNVLRNGVVIAQPTTTSYTDSGRTANTSYSYTVQAVDGAGNVSANSNTATVSTPGAVDTTAPTTPANLNATAASVSQVNLTWTASTDSGGSGLAGYNIYRNGTKLNSTPVTTTSYGDTTVAADLTYTYQVEAVDGSGNKSAKTSAVNVTTPAVKLGDITGPNGVPDGKIDLSDVSYVIRHYNTSDPTADITGPNGKPDGIVNIYDLSYIIRNYGK